MNRLSKSKLWILASIMLIVGAVVGASAMQAGRAPAAAAAAAAPAVREAATMPTTFAPVVKSVLPAVVNISSTKMVRLQSFPGGDQFGDIFRGFQFPQQQPQRQEAQGSGVIISADGYIMTNNHVVDGSKEVKVVLGDKREMTAQVIGKDAMTDIALIKIDAKDLPYVKMGNSAAVEVGDIALAIGNPFGIGQTVTMGIVSAKGRGGLGIEDYEDFIQTDASINPGNSGGALIDMKGELIGINTAILSPSGGNQGIGFAVPIDMARQVMTQLKEHGAVTRAYIGVTIKEVTPELATQLGIKSGGALIVDVVPDGPADKAGLHKDDVIVSLNGKTVDQRELRLQTGLQAPGTKVDLGVIHAGNQRTVAVNLGTMPKDLPKTAEEDSRPQYRRP